LGLGDFIKKGSGMDYLEDSKDRKPNSQRKNSEPQDDKFLKYLEQNLKRVNNEVEEMLEKVRVRRGL
jgi:hypothetical protein